MPVIKLSTVGQGGPSLDEVFDVDDDLFGRLLETVEKQDDLTMPEAFKRGMQHVVDQGPLGFSRRGQTP
jgi:hypothetical protein